MGKIEQYRIYKLNTFNLFRDEENKKYNELKKERKKMSELVPLLKKCDEMRRINSKALVPKKEIEIFNSDILRLLLSEDDLEHALIEDIIFVEIYHNEILEQIINKGFKCKGREFVFFTASAGQIRNEVVTCIAKDTLDKYYDNLMCGLTKEKINELGGCNVGKLFAYTSLVMSSSIPLEIDNFSIDNVIVVDDFNTDINEMIEYIDTTTFKSKIGKRKVNIEHMDGAGVILPNLINGACQIRGRWIKGAIFKFDFKNFALEVAHNTKVKDIYGKEWDIVKDDIKVILTASQFKMKKYYSSWDEYKKYFKKYNCKLSVTANENETQEQKELAYQFLQTLNSDISEGDIETLCADTVGRIKNLYTDVEEMKKILGVRDDESEILKGNPIQAAIKLYPTLLDDKHVQKQVRKTVSAYRKPAMGGKIIVDGFYNYICPDLYAFCEWLFQGKDNPKGLIPKNKVYNACYNDKDDNEVVMLRSPHLYIEDCKRDLIKSDECKEWFYGNNTIVSSHDLSSLVLVNDWDGDEILISNNRQIIDNIRTDEKGNPVPPLSYDMKKAEPEIINNETIFQTLTLGFENNAIGEISNAITKIWNSEDIDIEMVKLLQMYNNFNIDYAKIKYMIELPEAVEEKYKGIIKQQTPYFFRYAKDKGINQVAGLNDSVVNRVSQYVKKSTSNLRYTPFANEEKFNCSMLQRPNKNGMIDVRRDSKQYKELQQKLWNYDKQIQDLTKKMAKAKKDGDKDFDTKFDILYMYIKEDLVETYGGWNIALVNAIIDIEYYQGNNRNKQKNILWNCFGDIVLNNIKSNLESNIVIKSRPRLAYSKTNIEAYEKVKPKIKEMIDTKSVEITKTDYELIQGVKEKEQKLFYLVMCLCKAYNNRCDIVKRKKNKLTLNKLSDPDIQIAISMEGYTGVKLRNLVNMIYSKQELIKKAIGIEENIIDEDFIIGINEAKIETIKDFRTAVDDIGASSCEGLGFDFYDENIIFEFLRTDDREKVKVYSQLIEVVSNKAKELKRASRKQSSMDNPKYTMRTWLLRLGMLGDEYKVARKVLLEKLDGNGAFRNSRGE